MFLKFWRSQDPILSNRFGEVWCKFINNAEQVLDISVFFLFPSCSLKFIWNPLNKESCIVVSLSISDRIINSAMSVPFDCRKFRQLSFGNIIESFSQNFQNIFSWRKDVCGNSILSLIFLQTSELWKFSQAKIHL